MSNDSILFLIGFLFFMTLFAGLPYESKGKGLKILISIVLLILWLSRYFNKTI
jgi:hypothetical protein